MKKIKIKMDRNFLKEIKKYPTQEGWVIDWRTSTGCRFQDMQTFFPAQWVEMTPESVFDVYRRNPNTHVLFALVGDCKRAYSRGKIRNIYVEVWQ